MAIIQERFTTDGGEFIRTYSDAGLMIRGGFPEGDYAEAIDPAELNRTYIETDIPVDEDTNAEDILDIIVGGAE